MDMRSIGTFIRRQVECVRMKSIENPRRKNILLQKLFDYHIHIALLYNIISDLIICILCVIAKG